MTLLLDRLAARLPAAPRTRFAPAPTGKLHLGHVVNAVLVWGIARALGGRVLLRIEDHDGTRARPEFVHALLDDLAWLGFEADEGASPHLVRQSERGDAYEAALAQLDSQHLTYACDCTRRTLASVVPDLPNEEMRYPGLCRERSLDRTPGCGLRLRMADRAVTFDDANLGLETQVPALQCGDLLLRDRLGQWTYQFAVVADDLAQQISLVIRGRDLLASTGRQILLGELLGRGEPPVFLHHALLLHDDGSKLAKSRGSTGIEELRAEGVKPEAVLGLAAMHAGLLSAPRAVPVSALAELLALVEQLPGQDVRVV